jgi:hypothetical protein
VDAAGGEQARILNRPTTVEYGSTNSILYKTTRSLDAGTVRLTVEGTGQQFNMAEVGTGLGIYSVDIVADWGLGSYVISCSDPLASDRMIMEVVLAGAGSLGALTETIQSLETQMTNMTQVIQELSDPTEGLAAMMREIGTGVTQVEAALGAAIAGGGVGGATGAAASLEALLTGAAGGGGTEGLAETSLLGRIVGMSTRLEETFGRASDAAKFASSAKNEASGAANAVRELKTLLTGEFSPEAAMGRMEAIRRAVETANSNIENIPRAMGAQSLQSQLQSVVRQIEEMAKKQGFAYEVPQEKVGGGAEGGEATDEEMVKVLNQNMTEVKVSLEFMQKVLDDKLNEPVVQESWTGVE